MIIAILLLLIANVLLQWAVIFGLIRQAYGPRLEFEWRATLFGRVRHGVQVTFWEKPVDGEWSENYSVWSKGFSWRNPKTIPDYPYIRTRGERS